MTSRTVTETLRQQAVERAKELLDLDEQVRSLNVMRGLTRGNLMICLRRLRSERDASLRDLAAELGCSHNMLHDIEQGRRWSNEIVGAYLKWAGR